VSLVTGLNATVRITVDLADTATAVGSGDVPVLATPRLLALAEAATVAAINRFVPAEQTTVGHRVTLEHLRPTPVGGQVAVRAVLTEVDGRRLRFEVTARDGEDELVGRGEITRVLVDRAAFVGV